MPAWVAVATSEDPQSSGQSAGLGGGVHVRSMMSHRVWSAVTAHEMLPVGVLNQVGDVTTSSDVVVVGAAVVDVDVTVDVGPEEDPPPLHEARPTVTASSSPTTTFRTLRL